MLFELELEPEIDIGSLGVVPLNWSPDGPARDEETLGALRDRLVILRGLAKNASDPGPGEYSPSSSSLLDMRRFRFRLNGLVGVLVISGSWSELLSCIRLRAGITTSITSRPEGFIVDK